MNWEFVISDRNCSVGSHVNDFVKVVIFTGYKFFTWNGIVYGLGLDNQPFETGLTVKDLS